MKIDLVYLHIVNRCHPSLPGPEFYAPFMKRFLNTYAHHCPRIPHVGHVVWCGHDTSLPFQKPFWHRYNGPGRDIGAFQSVAKELTGDFAVFMGTVNYFWKDGWLERLAAAFEKHGNGLYGPMASYEVTPHIRTCCFACPPKLLLSFPRLVDTVEKCGEFEHCPGSFTQWVQRQGLPCKMVTWDGEYDQADWRKPANIFRSGDQSNCLVWDRHTDIYASASDEGKARLRRAADGLPAQ